MNLIQVQDQLKMLSDQQLQGELKAGDPSTQALVMSEVSRRQRLRAMSQPKPQKSIYEQMLGAPVPPLPPGMPGATPGAAPAAGPQPPAGLAGALPSAPGSSVGPPPAPGLASGGEVSQAQAPDFWDRLMHPTPEGSLSPSHIADAAAHLPGPEWQQMWEQFVNAWRDKQADAQPKPTPVQHYATSGVVKDLIQDDPLLQGQEDWTGSAMSGSNNGSDLAYWTPDNPPPPVSPYGIAGTPPVTQKPVEEQPLFGEPQFPFPTSTATPNLAGQPTYVPIKPGGAQGASREDTYGPMADTVDTQLALPKGLMRELARRETGGSFDPLAVGKDGELGITQIRDKYAQNTYGINPADRVDPAKSFLASGTWLSKQLKSGMSLRDALTFYNSGHTGPSEYADDIMARLHLNQTAPAAATVASAPSGVGGFNDFLTQAHAHGIGAETPLDSSKFKIDPATVGHAPRADYAAAKARAEALYGPDTGNDRLQQQLDELRTASAPKQLSMGDRLILFGAGMRNPWDVAGGISNQFQTQRQEDEAGRERAFKLYGLESGLQDRRQRRQEEVLREAGVLAGNEQTAGNLDWQEQNRLREEAKAADLQAAVYNNTLPGRNMQEVASYITAMGGVRALDTPNIMDLIQRSVHGDKSADAMIDKYLEFVKRGRDPNTISAYEQAVLDRGARNDAQKRLNDFITKNSDTLKGGPGAQTFQKLTYEQKREKYLETYPEDRLHLGAPITIPYNEIPGT